MKRIIFLLLATIVLHGCAIVKKQKDKLREDVSTHVAGKTDNSSNKTADSTASVKTADVHVSKETVTADTNVTAPGETLQVQTDVPERGETQTFETGDGSIQVAVDSGDKLHVKAETKPKVIPVHISRTSEVTDTHNGSVQTNVAKTEAARVNSLLHVDSSRHVNSVVMHKEVNRIGSWWMWLVLLLAAIVFVVYKVYRKGSNPLNWF